MYNNLFSPITINTLEVRNRIVYPALGLMYSFDGTLNDRYYNYFQEKARGGAGIVTVGPVGIDELGSGMITMLLTNDDAIPAFKKMTDLIKNEGARAWIQLFHAGAYSHPFLIGGKQPMAPSSVFSNYSKTTPKEMSKEEIKGVQQAFIDAGVRAKKAGFDGVEIIASAGYLITQFLSPLKNQRTDEYGGSFENRVRFPREIIEGMREKLGADYPVSIRMAGNDFVEGSNTDSETPEFAKVYEKAGVDMINVTGGWHETNVPQMTTNMPRSAFAYLAYNIKQAVSIPVIASNRINTPEVAESVLKDGYADMVSVGRALIADPHWANKAKSGRRDEIRPCVACLQGCMDGIMSGNSASCVANPFAGYENVREIKKTESPKKVMIIGAGLAGLEAAVTAKQAGHDVHLYEKKRDIGGQIWIASAPPHKEELMEFIRYYRTMLRVHNIPVHLNTEVTPELIEKENPDHIFVAEGAGPLIPPIQGTDDPSVMTAWDLLENNPRLGKEVAIIGGGAVGLESALFVAAKGALPPDALHFLMTYEAESYQRLKELMFKGSSRVTVFEMLPKVGKDVGKSTKWVLMSNLGRFKVDIKTDAKVIAIKDGKVIYERDGETQSKQFDNVIMASGSKSNKTMANKLETMNIPFTAIGDGVQIGKIDNAIHGGFLAALEI
ncbi:FAD-dependent oxidoreductase [bacterium]|nr:FAD-dependent oxidoreductase [bacterium]